MEIAAKRVDIIPRVTGQQNSPHTHKTPVIYMHMYIIYITWNDLSLYVILSYILELIKKWFGESFGERGGNMTVSYFVSLDLCYDLILFGKICI